MESDNILYLPGILDRILLNSDFATVVTLISLSKSWYEIIHNRGTWVSIGRQRGFYLSKERVVLPSAHLRILSQEHIHEGKCSSLQFDNKLDSNNPREQTAELESLLSQLSDTVCPLLVAHITLILDANTHLLDLPKISLLYLEVALKIVNWHSLENNEVLLDTLQPIALRVILLFSKYNTARQASSINSKTSPFHQAILGITARALPFYRKRSQFINEISKRNVVRALVFQVIDDRSKLYKDIQEVLYWILSEIDRHIGELSPVLEYIITTLTTADLTHSLQGLSHSRNISIWRQTLICFQDMQYSATWIGNALAQVCKDSPELFVQINQYEGTKEHLLNIWLKMPLREFMRTVAVKYEDWLKLRYIQSLEEKAIDEIISISRDDADAFNTLCFIATNANAYQDTIMEKRGVLSVIGSKTKSKNSVEAKTARDTVQKLMNKPKFGPLIAQELKNKTIVLY